MRAAFAALAVLPALALGTWIIRGSLEPLERNRSTPGLLLPSHDSDHWA